MKAVYALYPDQPTAQRAVDRLRAAGLGDAEITVLSSEPIEGHEPGSIGLMNKETWLWYIASAGGFVGLAFATWLTRMTELAWPLPTGNMPIVAWWPNLIVMFEMTMLGAILATVGTLVITSGLGRRRPVLYDPEVTRGRILVGVEDPQDRLVADVERALRVTPDVTLKTL